MKNEQMASLLQQVLDELHKTNFILPTKNSKHVNKASQMLNDIISKLWLRSVGDKTHES